MSAHDDAAERFRAEVMELGPAQIYPRDVELLRQGLANADVFFLESGIVRLQRVDQYGHEAIVQLTFPGAWIGTAAAMTAIAAPTSAITCSTCRVVRIAARTFRDRVRSDPEFSLFLHDVHARELCRQADWIGQLSSLTSRQRLEWVMRQLVDGVTVPGVRWGTRVPLRQWELARLIAVTPEHLSRLLKDLQREGIVRQERRSVMVDPHRLCTDEA